ncbi:AMP-binding protein [Siminovitchia sp. FSL H7-0308]|uniref:AMP-binding protein n=1 Tax=Siminovitchia sp. FSL H7-0308 TaxID=2921432 RepID=UPI0030EB47CB
MNDISVINRIAVGDIVRRSASRHPNKIAIIDGETRMTFSRLDEAANQFAHYLLKKGFEKGDRIVTISANSWQLIVAILGIQKAGLVWVPINPAVSLKEKNFIISDVKAKLILVDKDFIQQADVMKKSCPNILYMRSQSSDQSSFEALLHGEDTSEPEVHIQDRDLAQIMYTSGTTGSPRGVAIPHVAVFISSLGNIVEMMIKKDDIVAVILPIFHCALHSVVMSFIHIGGTMVVFRQFEPASYLEAVKKEKITIMIGLPMMYRALLHVPTRTKKDTESLRYCVYAMAPMDEKTLKSGIEEFEAKFCLATGQTEMYPATVIFGPEYQLSKFGSYWGIPSLINDTAIMGEDGHILDKGEVGEIVHRGPNVMACYYNRPDETEQSRLYGWHHTGDLGYFDEDGLLVFVDRKKDMIKTGGENVASILVEQTLLLHEKIENAVVVGLPHAHWIEAITAFVIPKEGVNVTKNEIVTHCKEHLSAFQVPKEVIFVDKLPITATGKIRKNILREQYKTYYTEQTIT